jgi:hypothetical protein
MVTLTFVSHVNMLIFFSFVKKHTRQVSSNKRHSPRLFELSLIWTLLIKKNNNKRLDLRISTPQKGLVLFVCLFCFLSLHLFAKVKEAPGAQSGRAPSRTLSLPPARGQGCSIGRFCINRGTGRVALSPYTVWSGNPKRRKWEWARQVGRGGANAPPHSPHPLSRGSYLLSHARYHSVINNLKS